MKFTKVLITAPLKQDVETFGFFQDALDALDVFLNAKQG